MQLLMGKKRSQTQTKSHVSGYKMEFSLTMFMGHAKHSMKPSWMFS